MIKYKPLPHEPSKEREEGKEILRCSPKVEVFYTVLTVYVGQAGEMEKPPGDTGALPP